ncbi:histidinol-phosphate aminotransferase family protein [Patescibacteria group bacterium]|nr:histidinol-phosphate aminotransferase family protein [Patescibacteria group bacterium]
MRLDFNERLAPLPAKVIDAIRNFDPQRFMVYPSYGDLVVKIAKYAQVDADSLMITNGSDQGMELIFRTFVSTGDKVLIPSPSFAMFYQVAQVQGAEIIKSKYKSDGNFPFDEVMELLKQKPKLVIICNPNNPTGTLLSLEKIETILKTTSETLIYVDEAYFEFSRVTAADLIKKYQNLFITRTFSKAFGLAALRIGYLMSCRANIDEMLKVRGPYDINQIAKVAADASLKTLPELKQYCDEVMKESKPFTEEFLREKGVEFFPSGANFIYFNEPFAGFSAELEGNGILIRPQADGYARVTIGKLSQMQRFAEIFNQITS